MAATAFFNHLSIPAYSKEAGIDMMCNLIKDLSELINSKCCNGTLASQDNLYSYNLADNYSVSQYHHEMSSSPDYRDIIMMLGRMSQRAPYHDELSSDIISEMAITQASLPDVPCCHESDIFLAAHLFDGFMASLPVEPHWSSPIIRIHCKECDEDLNPTGIEQHYEIPNLGEDGSREKLELRYQEVVDKYYVGNWDDLLSSFTPHIKFKKWLEEQTTYVQSKIMVKLEFVESLGSSPGKKHVKDVSGSFPEKYTVKEVRFTVDGNNEYRLLFEPIKHGKKHLLVGGIKNKDSWYRDMKDTIKSRSIIDS